MKQRFLTVKSNTIIKFKARKQINPISEGKPQMCLQFFLSAMFQIEQKNEN